MKISKLIIFILLFPGTLSVKANQEAHQRCLEAKDYAGCMSFQSGDLIEPKSISNHNELDILGITFE